MAHIRPQDRLPASTSSSRELRAHRWALGGLAAALAFGVAIPWGSAAVDVPHVFEPGQLLLAEEVNEDHEHLAVAIDRLVITEDLTVSISNADGCSRIQSELSDLSERRISASATVTIELEPGLYACNEPLRIEHPDGKHITIRGNGAAPGDVVLMFTGAGIVLDRGRTLGLVHNVTLQGAAELNTDHGVLVDRGSSVELSSIHIDGFHHGIHVSRSSSIVGYQLELRNSVQSGIFARLGSSVELNGCSAHDNGGDGFTSFVGSVMTISNSTAIANQGSGFGAARDATMIVTNVDSFDNGAFGYVAFHGAFLGRYGSYGSANNGNGDTNIAPNVTHPNDGTVIYGP